MPELNLSQAQALRIGNQDALAVRIANVDVWESPNPFVEVDVFQNESPISSHFSSYTIGTDLGAGGWTANVFYTYGSSYPGAEIVGARLWVPEGSSVIGESVRIGLFQKPAESELNWVGNTPGDVIDGLSTGDAVTSFPAGTLVSGWNNLYFQRHWPVHHYSFFAVGVSIGTGTKYIFGEEENDGPFRSRSGIRLALSEDHSGLHRGLYRYGTDSTADSNWSVGHYGIDAIIQIPISPQLYEHSIWTNTEPQKDYYNTYNELGASGWTTSHFYMSSQASEFSWQLVGARLWVPSALKDTAGVAGQSARCGYYINSAGAINNAVNTPAAVLNAVKSNIQPSITLAAGWNTCYFPEPIDIPTGAGIAIGWTIGDGDRYVSAGLGSNSYPSIDLIPFWLAASSDGPGERRGVYTDIDYFNNGQAYWSFQSNHYGGDLIVRRVT